MPIFVHNRVKESTTTSGSGSIALNGAATGFQAFSDVLSSGQQTYYTITNSSNWEVGVGTYVSNSLSRDTILSSNSGGSKINLSGYSTVFLAYPSEKSVFKDENDQVVLGPSGSILDTGIPTNTTNALYNVGGTLYFNGSAVSAVGADTLQSVTDRGSNTTNSIITSGNVTATTGVFDVLDLTLLGNGAQPPHSEGVLFYDSENHTLSLYNDEADVTLQLGQEEFLRVRNNTGSTITNGKVVTIVGSHGNAAPTIDLAIANVESLSHIAGLATHDIEPNSFGYVTTYGLVRNINTSGVTEGAEIFLSASESGGYTDVSPTIPNFKASIGHVISSHPSNGTILVQTTDPKLGGGDLKSAATVVVSGVPFAITTADANAGAVQTSSDFVYDSGNQTLLIGGNEVQVSGDNVSNFANDAGYLTTNTRSINFVSDGGGGVLSTGVKSYVTVPYNCTVQSWTILAENSGSIVVDVWKDSYANYPPTVADTIAGTEKPTISSGVKNQDNSLTTWSTSLSAGEIIAFNIDSVTDITKISLSIDVEVI